MAIFQDNEHHADETVRRAFTPADRNFLLNLQAELNTQSNMGNADPVFWVLKGTQSIVTGNSTDADETLLTLPESDTDYSTLTEVHEALQPGQPLYQLLQENGIEPSEIELITHTAGTVKWNVLRMTLGQMDDNHKMGYLCRYMEDVWEALQDVGLSDSQIGLTYLKNIPYIYPNTLFLTHADAQEHLKNYGYNYAPDTHAFAMTAGRSPRVEQLLRIIRTVDWNSVT